MGKGAGSTSAGSPEPGLTPSGHGPAGSKPCTRAPVQTTTKTLWLLANAPGLSCLTGDGRRERCCGSGALREDGGNQRTASCHQVCVRLLPTHRMQRVPRDRLCWGSPSYVGRAAAPLPRNSEMPEQQWQWSHSDNKEHQGGGLKPKSVRCVTLPRRTFAV